MFFNRHCDNSSQVVGISGRDLEDVLDLIQAVCFLWVFPVEWQREQESKIQLNFQGKESTYLTIREDNDLAFLTLLTSVCPAISRFPLFSTGWTFEMTKTALVPLIGSSSWWKNGDDDVVVCPTKTTKISFFRMARDKKRNNSPSVFTQLGCFFFPLRAEWIKWEKDWIGKVQKRMQKHTHFSKLFDSSELGLKSCKTIRKQGPTECDA